MKPELKKRIHAYNKSLKARREKASDLDVLMERIMQLPYGQLKKVLSAEVVKILEKYGYGEG